MITTLRSIGRDFKIRNGFMFGDNMDFHLFLRENTNKSFISLPEGTKIKQVPEFDYLYYSDASQVEKWLWQDKPSFEIAFVGKYHGYFRKRLLIDLATKKTNIIIYDGFDSAFKTNLRGYYCAEFRQPAFAIYYRDLIHDLRADSDS